MFVNFRAISVMYHSVWESVAFTHIDGTDPSGITPFYQKAHFLKLDKVMTENRAAV